MTKETNEKIRVMIKHPGECWKSEVITDNFDEIEKIVGGKCELEIINDKFVAYYNVQPEFSERNKTVINKNNLCAIFGTIIVAETEVFDYYYINTSIRNDEEAMSSILGMYSDFNYKCNDYKLYYESFADGEQNTEFLGDFPSLKEVNRKVDKYCLYYHEDMDYAKIYIIPN